MRAEFEDGEGGRLQNICPGRLRWRGKNNDDEYDDNYDDDDDNHEDDDHWDDR